MARYEAERQARLEARRKAREQESQSSGPSAAATTVIANAPVSPRGETSKERAIETQKAIEANLDEWEEERKERLAEREREAKERKAALETQLAMEEAERKKRLEERRKQREIERQKEEAEEAARKARLEERRREREAQRLAEEKEYEEKAAARKRAREEREKMLAGIDSASSATTSSTSTSDSKSTSSKDKGKDKKDTSKATHTTDAAAEAKRALDADILSSYEAWGAKVSPPPSSTTTSSNTSNTSSSHPSSSHSTAEKTISAVTASNALLAPRNESPTRESPARRKRLGEIGRSSMTTKTHADAGSAAHATNSGSSSPPPTAVGTSHSASTTAPMAVPTPSNAISADTTASTPPIVVGMSPSPIPAGIRLASASLASSGDSIADELKIEEEKRAREEEEEQKRKEKEEEETRLLKAAADAEIALQAEADAKIREEMRKEEEALVAKEKAAEEAAEKAAAQTFASQAPQATSTASNAAPAAAKSSAASKMKSLLAAARQQQTQTGSKHHRISTTERPIGHVPSPSNHRLTTMELFSVGGGGGAKRLPDPDLIMNHFVREGRLTRDCATEILLQIRTAFLYEKNVVTVPSPAYVIGDIHGQFYDLLHLFRSTGLPGQGENNFVFLGDYVDRGTFSCEVCLVLFVCKLRWPKKVTLLRGNHETRAMTSYHNFQKEATHKYGASVYEMFMEVFDHLPLAAIVEPQEEKKEISSSSTASLSQVGRVFCCHGGLSPAFKTIDEIQALDRFQEPEDDGAICDLIWADPVVDDKFFNQNFSRNKERGCSVVFGYNPIYDFLEFNNLSFIVRAHQVEEKGYRELHFSQAPPGRTHPMVITLFSAPNYCDSYENMAAYLSIGKDEYNFHQYTWQQHPYCLPDFSNAIKFSLPFIAENIMKFLVGIIETVQATDLDKDDIEDGNAEADDAEAEKTLDTKLRAVGKSFILLKKMRETSMTKLGNIIEQQKLHQQQSTSLVSGETQNRIDAARSRGGRRKVQRVVSDLSDIVRMASEHFKQAKALDADNERFHGRAAWKSTFRKLGRGVSFKI